MRLSSRAVSLLCLAAVLLPLGASAAVAKLKLRDISAIIQSNKKPLAYELLVRGNLGKASATLKITGKQNGNMKSLAKAAADLTFVFDAKMDADTSGHAKARAVLVDQTIYFRLDELTATGEWEEFEEESAEFVGKWFSEPIAPDEYAAYIQEEQRSRRTSNAEIEAFFDIVKEELRDRTRYTVTIPKNKQRRLLAMLAGSGYHSYIRTTTIDFNLTVDTVKNVFDALAGMLKISTKISGETAKFTLSGKTNALRTAPIISAPSPSTPWEEFTRTAGGKSMEDARNAQRRSDVNTILNANYQYAIDNNGNYVSTIHTGTTDAICATNHDCDGISLDTLTGSYLVRIPSDPSIEGDSPVTGYTILKDANGRLTISAPMAENDAAISVTR